MLIKITPDKIINLNYIKSIERWPAKDEMEVIFVQEATLEHSLIADSLIFRGEEAVRIWDLLNQYIANDQLYSAMKGRLSQMARNRDVT